MSLSESYIRGKRGTYLAPVDDGVPVLSSVIHHVDVIQVGICPVHQLLDYIQGHSCGLFDLIIHQPGAVGAVQVAALDLGSVPVISEEHHSAERENDGWPSSRAFQVIVVRACLNSWNKT